MSKLFSSILASILGGLSKLIIPLLAWYKGRLDKEGDIAKDDVKILQRQRDNDTDTIGSTMDKWVRIRKKHK